MRIASEPRKGQTLRQRTDQNMAGRKLVNLDAMIPRADFAIIEDNEIYADDLKSIGPRDFRPEGLMPLLRKPDFQRETNHWSSAQVLLLIQSFIESDLIPSVILWKAQGSIFVIDRGHRLSVLRAWIEDDYGDRAISQKFFGYNINEAQKRVAQETRRLIDREVGSYGEWLRRGDVTDLPLADKAKVLRVRSGSIPIQWVSGNVEKAQASFLKINTQGTALDDIEMLLIRNRRRPAAIAARSIIRAGMGHKYWSGFTADKQRLIEEKAGELYRVLFEPDLQSRIKTIDLPLGGGAGVRSALKLLVEFVLTASRDQQGKPEVVDDQEEDDNGEQTVSTLNRSLRLANRITGNTNGSLGLHRAVYFYGPTGTHMAPLFMGIVTLLAKKIIDNDPSFFRKFQKVRCQLEEFLLDNKRLIVAIIQNTRSTKRYTVVARLIDYLVDNIVEGVTPSEQDLVNFAGVGNKVFTGQEADKPVRFPDETKNAIMIKTGLNAALKCDICKGYISPSQSISYDHIVAVRDGGRGTEENCAITHPYCNQSKS